MNQGVTDKSGPYRKQRGVESSSWDRVVAVEK